MFTDFGDGVVVPGGDAISAGTIGIMFPTEPVAADPLLFVPAPLSPSVTSNTVRQLGSGQRIFCPRSDGSTFQAFLQRGQTAVMCTIDPRG